MGRVLTGLVFFLCKNVPKGCIAGGRAARYHTAVFGRVLVMLVAGLALCYRACTNLTRLFFAKKVSEG
jgi:hypothetical protein